MVLIEHSLEDRLERIPVSFQKIGPASQIDIAGGEERSAQRAFHVLVDFAGGRRSQIFFHQDRVPSVHRMNSGLCSFLPGTTGVLKCLYKQGADQQQRRVVIVIKIYYFSQLILCATAEIHLCHSTTQIRHRKIIVDPRVGLGPQSLTERKELLGFQRRFQRLPVKLKKLRERGKCLKKHIDVGNTQSLAYLSIDLRNPAISFMFSDQMELVLSRRHTDSMKNGGLRLSGMVYRHGIK